MMSHPWTMTRKAKDPTIKAAVMIAAVALLLILSALAAGASAAPAAGSPAMGISAGRDLDALWAAAREIPGFEGQDAVVLLESRRVSVAADGAVATRVHRVVWINSAVGIRSYADLRVPWNGADSDLAVEILRTWRDGRWWPDPATISETAVVHTLPRALERADDYCAMRETMLLHDGVEAPCILETAYTVTERGATAADGLFLFPQRDPAVLVELAVEVPADLPVHHQGINGAPEATVGSTADRRTLLWAMSPAPALKLPVTEQPAAYEPAVVWSTWTSWDALAAEVLGRFDAAAAVQGAAADSAAVRAARAADQVLAVRSVLDFVDESTRRIAYDDRSWRLSPRPAARTWETGYGHDLDRSVLAAGLLRSLTVPARTPAGGPGRAQVAAEITPIFVGRGTTAIAPAVPRLEGIGALALRVTLKDGVFIWSASTGLHDAAWSLDRPVTTLDPLRPLEIASCPAGNGLTLGLALVPGKDGGWDCTGALAASGVLGVHGPVTSSGRTLEETVGEAVGPLLADLKVQGVSPRSFLPDEVSLEFTGSLPDTLADEHGRTTLLVGAPGGGVVGHLPGDVHLWEASREAPVLMAGSHQEITLQVRIGRAEVEHMPASVDIANAAGRFQVECAAADGRLTYRRSLTVSDPRRWAELRQLLLEETDPAHGTIVWKEGGLEEKETE